MYPFWGVMGIIWATILLWRPNMARYAIYVFCDYCDDPHQFAETSLNDGPAQKESIGNFYAGKALPPEVATFINNSIQCFNTGRMVTQKDNNQIFLVPIGD